MRRSLLCHGVVAFLVLTGCSQTPSQDESALRGAGRRYGQEKDKGNKGGNGGNDGGLTSEDCTRTQGYWKNHGGWPVTSLTLGTTVYTEAELRLIFGEPVRGNGLISLAHQLIAAKLNIAAGADGAVVASAIVAADALIGGLVVPPIGSGELETSVTSALNATLTAFNEGTLGPAHCGETPPPPNPACGDGKLDAGEACDDGNTMNGDGCSSTCTVETPPPPPGPACGDGKLDAGEACDDGNTMNGDGCSSTCTVETPPPPPAPCCGDGKLDAGEQCDDGNLVSGDGCSATCTIELPPAPVCGNGIVESGEECDDGNTVNDDACDNSCKICVKAL